MSSCRLHVLPAHMSISQSAGNGYAGWSSCPHLFSLFWRISEVLLRKPDWAQWLLWTSSYIYIWYTWLINQNMFFSLFSSTETDKKSDSLGLPWWLSGKESTWQCRRHGFDPRSGRIPHTEEQLSPCTTAPEPRSRNYWAHVPQLLKPGHPWACALL